MAHMTHVQTRAKFSRDVLWDSLHAFYFTYVDVLFTDDQDFLDVREALNHHRDSQKIQRISETSWTFVDRQNPPRDRLLAVSGPNVRVCDG